MKKKKKEVKSQDVQSSHPPIIRPYQYQKEVLIEYLLMKVETEDWHAVSDAATDLRELAVREQCHDRTR